MIHIDIFFDLFKNSLPGKLLISVLTGMVGTAILVVFFFPLLSANGLLKLLPWVVGFNAALTGYTLIDKTKTFLKHRHLFTGTAGALCAVSACGVVAVAALRLQGVLLITVSDLATLLPIGMVAGWLGGILAVKYFGLNLKSDPH